jgi:hypothetical protein
MAVKTMVQGIKNSTHFAENLMMSKTLNANVMLWPMVKAVTKINTCFQSFNK